MEIVVDTREFNGKIYYKVRWIQLPGERGALQKNSMNDNQRLDFSERMRGIAMNIPAPGAAQGAANSSKRLDLRVRSDDPAMGVRGPDRGDQRDGPYL